MDWIQRHPISATNIVSCEKHYNDYTTAMKLGGYSTFTPSEFRELMNRANYYEVESHWKPHAEENKRVYVGMSPFDVQWFALLIVNAKEHQLLDMHPLWLLYLADATRAQQLWLDENEFQLVFHQFFRASEDVEKVICC